MVAVSQLYLLLQTSEILIFTNCCIKTNQAHGFSFVYNFIHIAAFYGLLYSMKFAHARGPYGDM